MKAIYTPSQAEQFLRERLKELDGPDHWSVEIISDVCEDCGKPSLGFRFVKPGSEFPGIFVLLSHNPESDVFEDLEGKWEDYILNSHPKVLDDMRRSDESTDGQIHRLPEGTALLAIESTLLDEIINGLDPSEPINLFTLIMGEGSVGVIVERELFKSLFRDLLRRQKIDIETATNDNPRS